MQCLSPSLAVHSLPIGYCNVSISLNWSYKIDISELLLHTFVLLNIHEMNKLEQIFFMLVKFYLAPQILFFSKEQNTYIFLTL